MKTQATRGNAPGREGWKWTLVQLLYERDYTEEEVIRFFRVLDWMMTLPSVLQESFDSKLRQYQAVWGGSDGWVGTGESDPG